MIQGDRSKGLIAYGGLETPSQSDVGANAFVVSVATGWLLHRGGVDSTPDLEVALALPAGHSFALNNWPELTLSADGRRQVSTVYDQAGQSHLVITSYSIHYTKLYETRVDGGGEPVAIAPSGNQRFPTSWSANGALLFTELSPETHRITSYNVCYTKLLRLWQVRILKGSY